jgi:hypothetical protein
MKLNFYNLITANPKTSYTYFSASDLVIGDRYVNFPTP